jgi:hypothetical protein
MADCDCGNKATAIVRDASGCEHFYCARCLDLLNGWLRTGIIPPIESDDATLDGVEPEPVGIAQHHTIGGRGAVARLRKET